MTLHDRRTSLLAKAASCLNRLRAGEVLTPIENALARALRRSSIRAINAVAGAHWRTGDTKTSARDELTVPLTAVFMRPVGDRCNLACSYCYQDGIRHRSGHSTMSLDLLESTLIDISRIARFPLSIAWHGGEPLLAGKAFFRRAIELIGIYFPAGAVQNSVQTNGVLLDDEWLSLFEAAGFSIGISLDGNREMHDRQRIFRGGTGSYDLVERAALRASLSGIPLNAICVVGEDHVGAAERVLNEIERLKFDSCNIQPSFYFTSEAKYVDPTVFVEFALDFVGHWWRRQGHHINVMLIDNCLETILNRSGSDCVFSGRCSQLLAVSHDGDVRPCSRPFEGQYESFGNVRHGLTSIANSSTADRFRKSDLAAQKNIECEFRSICNQGCPQHRIDKAGNQAIDGGNVFCGCTNASGVGYDSIWAAILSSAESGEFKY